MVAMVKGPGAALLVVVLAWAAFGPLAALAAVGLIGVGVLIHAQRFPWRKCRVCKGTRKLRGGWGTFAICTNCDKEGKVRRWGAPRI